MPGDEEVGGLLRLARILTGRRGAAVDLVRVPGLVTTGAGAGGELGARDRLLHDFLAVRRSRSGPRAPLELDGLPDDLARVARRFDSLSRLERVVVALTFAERTTLREIAGVLGRSPASVDRILVGGSFALGAPPSVITAALDAVAGLAPEIQMVHRAPTRRPTTPARGRRRGLVVAAVLVVAVLALTVGLRVVRGPYVRPDHEWSGSFDYAPPDGWEVEGRTLTPTTDSVTLHATYGQSPPCLVGVESGAFRSPAGRSVEVDGRPGWFVAGRPDDSSHLSWRIIPGVQGTVRCASEQSDTRRVDLARRVHPARVPVAVPFDLRPVGGLVRVTALQVGGAAVTAELLLSGTAEPSVTRVDLTAPGSEEPSQARSVPAGSVGAGSARSGSGTSGSGAAVRVHELHSRLVVCLELGPSTACAGTNSGGLSRSERGERIDELMSLLRGVHFAEDLTDPTGWFDARAAIPT